LEQRYDVTVTRLRREALSHLEAAPPNLILVDVSSIRFDVMRFFDAFDDLPVSLTTFLLLGKGMRLDQMPKANGYLRHPFSPRHLMRRLSRVLPESPRDTVVWRQLCLDKENHFLIWDGQQVPLTPKQAALALVFLTSPETIVSREQLMKQVWGTDYMGDTRTLDVHIHWLRGALEDVTAPFIIETKRGVGYQLLKQPAEAAG
jgi:DNA-binding response OmpR family regulator